MMFLIHNLVIQDRGIAHFIALYSADPLSRVSRGYLQIQSAVRSYQRCLTISTCASVVANLARGAMVAQHSSYSRYASLGLGTVEPHMFSRVGFK